MVGTGAALPPRARGPPSPPPRPRRGHEAGAGGAGTRGGTERCPPAGPWTDRRGRCHRAEPEGVAGGRRRAPCVGGQRFRLVVPPRGHRGGNGGTRTRSSRRSGRCSTGMSYIHCDHASGPGHGQAMARDGWERGPKAAPPAASCLGTLPSVAPRAPGPPESNRRRRREEGLPTRRRDTCDITHEQTCAQGFGAPESSEPPGSGEAGGSRARGRRVPYATRSSRPESALLSR